MSLERRVCDVPAALVRVGGNSLLLREMLDLFCQDAAVFQEHLKSAIAVSDGAALQKATHGLRGMLAYFSAEVALEIAERIEQMALPSNQARAQAAALDLFEQVASVESLAKVVAPDVGSDAAGALLIRRAHRAGQSRECSGRIAARPDPVQPAESLLSFERNVLVG